MSFDTKYLIRWGIPGWVFLIVIVPFLYFNFNKEVLEIIENTNSLALGAAITLIGVPLGYLFNQLHHFLFWVINYKNWTAFFEKEIKVDLFLANEENKEIKERYRYLLSKKHEVGSVLISFGISTVTIGMVIVNSEPTNFLWIYFCIVFSLTLVWLGLRFYSSANVDKLFDTIYFLALRNNDE